MENGRRFAITSALGLTATEALPDETGGGKKITEDQATYIADLCSETGTPPSRVLKLLKVEKIEDILAVDYDSVIKPLQERKTAKGPPNERRHHRKQRRTLSHSGRRTGFARVATARLGIPTASNFDKIITPKTMKPSASAEKYAWALIAEQHLGEPT
jgi:hypothetical protein